MKKLLYLNSVAATPTAELHAAQKESSDKSMNLTLLANSYSTRQNHFTYLYEIHRANSVAQFYGLPLKKIQLSKPKSDLSNDIVEKLNIGVMSSIASYLRITEYNQLSPYWKKLHRQLLNNSINIYRYFESELPNYDQLLIYNGRFAEDSAAKYAAVMTNTSYKVYDFKKAGSYYEFEDCPLHSVQENCRRAKQFYISNPKVASSVAHNFMQAKLQGKATYEKS